MAELNAGNLRRALRSVDRLRDRAIRLGSVQVNTPSSRSSALLSLVTFPDQGGPAVDLDLGDFGVLLPLTRRPCASGR